jgi:hypothetical protein
MFVIDVSGEVIFPWVCLWFSGTLAAVEEG